MKIATILGTRPEIIKLSSLIPLLEKEFNHFIIHTGQHYDYNMDKVFFDDLHLKEPNYRLNVGSHSQGKQTGLLLERIEKVLLQEEPELVIIEGDTNTALAGVLAAVKIHIPVMHVESGCRSFNKLIPEEINRVIIDHIANYLIAPDDQSYQNLLREGISKDKIFLSGSTAFDAVARNTRLINAAEILKKQGLEAGQFALITLHRAENTDDLGRLQNVLDALNFLADKIKFVFPVHPRTLKMIKNNNLKLNPAITIVEPQAYLHFLALLSSCKFCITDSGGIQEEALVFNVPCLIPREETEWTRLIEAGKNFLIGTQSEKIVYNIKKFLDDEKELQRVKEIQYTYRIDASERIIKVIAKIEHDSLHR